MRIPALPKTPDGEKPSRLERLRELFLKKVKGQKTYVKVPKRK